MEGNFRHTSFFVASDPPSPVQHRSATKQSPARISHARRLHRLSVEWVLMLYGAPRNAQPPCFRLLSCSPPVLMNLQTTAGDSGPDI